MKGKNFENMNNKSIIEEMHMMFFLLLNESIREMQEGYCSKICISLLPNNHIEITDDGRGIPLIDEMQKSTQMLNQIFGGHPISSLDYACIEDFNNLELNMVNSLCEKMNVCVWKNDKRYVQDYIRGIAQHELLIEEDSHHSGMKVLLKPDSSIFGDTLWSKEFIEEYISKNASKYIELK